MYPKIRSEISQDRNVISFEMNSGLKIILVTLSKLIPLTNLFSRDLTQFSSNLLESHLIYRHLLVDREFVVVSHLKIFPLQLLGPAIGFSAGPSSCKGKILRWDTTTNSLTTNKCLYIRCDFSRPLRQIVWP